MPKCVKCGKRRKHLSQRKLCEKCRTIIHKNVVAQIRAKNGPYFNKWKAGISKYAENLNRK